MIDPPHENEIEIYFQLGYTACVWEPAGLTPTTTDLFLKRLSNV